MAKTPRRVKPRKCKRCDKDVWYYPSEGWKDELSSRLCEGSIHGHRPTNELRPEQKKIVENLTPINAAKGRKNPTGPGGVLSG